MFYAVPAVIVTFGVGLALVALRSGVFVDDRGLVVKPYAGVRSQRIPLDNIRAVTVTRKQGAVFAWVSPAVVPMSGDTVAPGAGPLRRVVGTYACFASGRSGLSKTRTSV